MTKSDTPLLDPIVVRLRERFGPVDESEGRLYLRVHTLDAQAVELTIIREPCGQDQLLTICALLHRALELSSFEALRWNFHLRVGVICVAGEAALLRHTCLLAREDADRVDELVELLAAEAARLQPILQVPPDCFDAFAHLA
jgi:hypothetical protein